MGTHLPGMGSVMSDETNTETAETDASTDTTAAVDWEAEAKKWRALSRKTEADNKRNAERLAEFENANKSEIEKAEARAAAAEKKATEIELTALRASVALEKGLTPSQAKRLVGASREEFESDADELLADLKIAAPGVTTSAQGQGKQGAAVGQGPNNLNDALRALRND